MDNSNLEGTYGLLRVIGRADGSGLGTQYAVSCAACLVSNGLVLSHFQVLSGIHSGCTSLTRAERQSGLEPWRY